MAQSYSITESGFLVIGRGIIEILSLVATGVNSTVTFYDGGRTGSTAGSSGSRLWDLAALANSPEFTPVLNIPYKSGIFGVFSGAGRAAVTVR